MRWVLRSFRLVRLGKRPRAVGLAQHTRNWNSKALAKDRPNLFPSKAIGCIECGLPYLILALSSRAPWSSCTPR